MASVARELHLALQFHTLHFYILQVHILRTSKQGWQQQNAAHNPERSETKLGQNNIPMARLSWLVELALL